MKGGEAGVAGRLLCPPPATPPPPSPSPTANVFTCLRLSDATSDDDTLSTSQPSLANPSRAVMISCDSRSGSLQSTVFSSADCAFGTAISVLNYSVSGCATLPQWTSGAFRTTVSGFCRGQATPSQAPSLTPLRLTWAAQAFASSAEGLRPSALALALALALVAAAAAPRNPPQRG